MIDLFENQKKTSSKLPRGKMGDLARFILAAGHAKTSDVAQWGCDHYYVSAVRAACQLCFKGFLRRMTDEEAKLLLGYASEQGVWVPTDQLREAAK